MIYNRIGDGMQKHKHLGLNEWARNLVSGGRVGKFECGVVNHPDGAIEFWSTTSFKTSGPVARKVVSTRFYETVSTEHIKNTERRVLYDYFLPPRRSWQPEVVLHEEVQFTPMHSGTAYCLALRDTHGQWIQESLWPVGTAGSQVSLPPSQFIRTAPLRP